MRTPSLRFIAIALFGLPVAAAAQGTLSTQGFGYPGGQLSTRALATGGAVGEMDPLSPINPAAIFGLGGASLYFQAEPEYRTLHSGTTQETSAVARYPLVAASVPLTETLLAGVSVSNLLDRTFSTSVRSVQSVNGTIVGSTDTYASDGAIGDLRLALAWAPNSRMRLGAAGHVITGDNRLSTSQVFDDSTRYGSIRDTSTVSYVGSAYSAGFQLLVPGGFNLAGSYRRGGSLSAKHADTTLRSAHVPDRTSFSVAYVGVRGATLAVRTSKEGWSSMSGMLSGSTPITEKWDTSVGADVLGPTLFGSALQLRAGARQRTLPFGIPAQTVNGVSQSSAAVDERSYALGVGGYLARGRASVDLTGSHASRTSVGTPLTESAWTMSVGIMVRP